MTMPKTLEEVSRWLKEAEAAQRTGLARKTRPVDARPAAAGEVVVTIIQGEGAETRNTAKAGDWVVRNRCPATGNEQYVVEERTFEEKYGKPRSAPDADGWQEFHPKGKTMRFSFVRAQDRSFSFRAPWGEPVVARPGDAIVQDPDNERDVYRVARAAFDCTYEIVEPPARGEDSEGGV